MKKILIPTDYSENARNASEYAIQLAKATGAAVEFLHVFPELENIEELPSPEKYFVNQLKKEKAKLNKEARRYGEIFGVSINTVVYPGKLDEVLKIMMDNEAADLVVVGIKGINVIDKILWGNTTTRLLKKVSFPLLIIPSNKKFEDIKHITLAADYDSFIAEQSFSILKDLTAPFKGKTEIVHVDDSEEDLTEYVDKNESVKYFRKAFSGLKHSYTTLEADSIISGLSDFIKTRNSDMIVMIPQKHHFFQKLFLGSSIKKMAYQTDIPLLVLPPSR